MRVPWNKGLDKTDPRMVAIIKKKIKPRTVKACGTCNTTLVLAPHQRTTKYCSTRCYGIAKAQIKGERHPQWKGDTLTYGGFHRRVYRERGQPVGCVHCGLKDVGARYEWANTNGDYTDVENYIRLCVPCHRKMDGNLPINAAIRRMHSA